MRGPLASSRAILGNMLTRRSARRGFTLMIGTSVGLGLTLGACARRMDTAAGASKRCTQGVDSRPSLFPEGAFSQTRDSYFDVFPTSKAEEAWTRCIVSAQLSLMSEASLLSAAPGVEVYRFLWVRPFRDLVSLRIEWHKGSSKLVVRQLRNTEREEWGPLNVDRTVAVSSAQWTEFLRLLEAAHFWNPPASSRKSELIYADASTWMLEGVRDGHYRAMDVLSPEKEGLPGAYRAACLYLLTLSGLQIPANEIY